MKLSRIAVVLIATAGILGGCASDPFASDSPPRVERRIEYGVVERIDLLRAGRSEPTGLGAILGGIAGGVIGHQIGGGFGNSAATVAGAVGGALLGNHIEHSNEGDRYRITVRLDNGERLEVSEVGEGELRIGDRVRVVNNRVYRA
jgi:outer membrane lipoprotein SlyB